MSDSPAAILYDGYGKPLAVRDGYDFGANNSALLAAGKNTDAEVKVFNIGSDGGLRVDPTGTTTQPVRELVSSVAVRTNVPVSINDTLLLASNSNRKNVFIYNDSTSVLRVGLGTVPTDIDNFTFLLVANTIWEVPRGFVGEIRGHWNNADVGFARITELV